MLFSEIPAAQLADTIRSHTFVATDAATLPAENIVLLGCASDPAIADAVRAALANMAQPMLAETCAIADLGNLPPTASAAAACEQIAATLQPLIAAGKFILLLGDDSALQFGQFLAYEGLEKRVCIADISAHFTAATLLDYSPTPLFDYTLLGYQRYFVAEETLNALHARHYTPLRYGDLADDLRHAEPFLRDAHLAHFSLSAIRRMDAPATARPSVGGFSAMEACRLARYAGMSPRLSSFFCSDMRPDSSQQTPQLAALLLWYAIEGYTHRHYDHPSNGGAHFQKYAVTLTLTELPLIFYQNTATERWWLEIPQAKHTAPMIVACSERDFRLARENALPDRWWAMFERGLKN